MSDRWLPEMGRPGELARVRISGGQCQIVRMSCTWGGVVGLEVQQGDEWELVASTYYGSALPELCSEIRGIYLTVIDRLDEVLGNCRAPVGGTQPIQWNWLANVIKRLP